MCDNGEVKTDLVILVDEEGNEHDFAVLDRFFVESSEYAILVPVSVNEEDDDTEEMSMDENAYIFRIDLDEGEETLVEVEDESEWEAVASVWEERVQDIDFDEESEQT